MKFNYRYLAVLYVCCYFIMGCSQQVVPITDSNIASLPVITINGFPDGGNIEKNNQTSQTAINADYGMAITISGSAKTPDGVKDFTIEIFRGARRIFMAAIQSSPGSGGKVPSLLPIIGTNNTGGVGNTPMKFIMDSLTEVKVSAHNYAGELREFSLLYVPVAATQRGKDIQENIILRKDNQLGIFAARFPNFPANGKLVALNGSGVDVYLLKQTNGLPFNCSDPNATIRLQAFGNLFGPDYNSLFGSQNPSFPLELRACMLGPSANSQQVELKITYRLN
jgi:hypothetical protein